MIWVLYSGSNQLGDHEDAARQEDAPVPTQLKSCDEDIGADTYGVRHLPLQ